MIPSIDIPALFAADCDARRTADREIMTAATESGFMLVTGLPADIPLTQPHLQVLKRIFDLPPGAQRPLWRQKFAAENPNIYRGWFPLQDGHLTYKEGIDIGPDLIAGQAVADPTDPLCEPTPLPPDSVLPGWRDAAAAYYKGMMQTGGTLMRSLARGLGLDERIFDAAFAGGISTLRLIRYPPRSAAALAAINQPDLWVMRNGQRAYLTGAPHVDSGLVTLLAQDGVSGLQAMSGDGNWLDVPPLDQSLVVNFGRLLERWTAGRIKATRHRVIGFGIERYSFPFFYEPRVDAVIAPLPLPHIPGVGNDFAPFLYGDHLWAATTKFVEFAGLEHVRPPRGKPNIAADEQRPTPLP
jgi:isopenicillin N synthase-like dioxygenase